MGLSSNYTMLLVQAASDLDPELSSDLSSDIGMAHEQQNVSRSARAGARKGRVTRLPTPPDRPAVGSTHQQFPRRARPLLLRSASAGRKYGPEDSLGECFPVPHVQDAW